MTKEQAKEKIKQLINRYQNLTPQEKKMNEEMTKTKFIRPLFEALGWNFEKDVLLEDKISHGRVDYNFQIDGKTKFFMEAKPLKADIDNLEYAKQATNYAWLKNINWAVLTDFQGIRIFYPAERGQAKACLRLNFDDYIKSFDDLWVLSKESFKQNLISQEAVKWGAKPEEIKVGEQLSKDMNTWRQSLYDHFKTWNNLSDQELDEGVQKILDRFIFVRSCEDRGLENDTLRSKYRIWQDDDRKGNFLAYLNPFFAEYKKNYNSGLFDDHPVMDWEIASDCFDEIINGLYRSKNNQEYDFSVINADVLGGVYEQYLGHLLLKSDDGDASKKKRKSQGIYYTPTFIVDYIVQNTLGKVLQEKSPQEITDLKILDPACGSGSFLIKAFDYLANYQVQNKNKKKFDLNTQLGQLEKYFRNRDGIKELSVNHKLNILRNNIYGVDLDQQAVEIAQLNLMLKTLDRKQELPHLNNIKCGNSLIDDPKIAGEKAFKWNEEFSEVMKDGGFDIVIGNPPYIGSLELSSHGQEKTKDFFKEEYKSAVGNFDIYVLFLEKALEFVKQNGLISFIIPNKFLVNDYGKEIREILLKYQIVEILNVSNLNVFGDAAVYPIIITIKKQPYNEKHKTKIRFTQNDYSDIEYNLIRQSTWVNNDKKIISLDLSKNNESIFGKLADRSLLLKEIAHVQSGTTGFDYTKYGDLISENRQANFIKFVITKNIDPYFVNWKKTIHYFKKTLREVYFDVENKIVTSGRKNLYKDKNKILIRGMSKKLICGLDTEGYALGVGTYAVTNSIYNNFYLLAIMNSKLADYFYKTKFISKHLAGGYIGYNVSQLEQIPICKIDLSIPAEKSKHDELVKIAIEMLKLNKELQTTEKGTNRWNQIKSEIDRTDDKINQTVYKLYNLTQKEIKIVEESLK